jgi:hypothetical protein
MRERHTQVYQRVGAPASNVLVNRSQNKLVNIRSTKTALHAVMRSVSI